MLKVHCRDIKCDECGTTPITRYDPYKRLHLCKACANGSQQDRRVTMSGPDVRKAGESWNKTGAVFVRRNQWT